MKITNIKTISDFLIYCHMPIYFKSNIRLMKNGDLFFLGQYKESEDFIAEAWIKKEKKSYKFFGTWTIPTKPKRPFIMTFGNFQLLKGGVIQFNDDLARVKSFSLVCRYILFITDKSPTEERQRYFSAGANPFFIGTWLNKNAICRKRHFDIKTQQFIYYNYEDHLPTQQLQAIVSAGIALSII